MPGMSPPTSLKGDPDVNVKRVLKWFHQEDILSDVSRWLDLEPQSPGQLKKHFITTFNAETDGTPIDYNLINLKDPTTFGDGGLPPDEFFLELYRAIKADEKRRASRGSYEF